MTGFRNNTWDEAVILMNLKDELQRHPELRKLNTKLNTQYNKARTKLKALAEKHNTKEFMNKSDLIIKHFRGVSDEIPTFADFTYSTLKKKAENRVQQLKEYSSECWYYCQGDTRKQI